MYKLPALWRNKSSVYLRTNVCLQVRNFWVVYQKQKYPTKKKKEILFLPILHKLAIKIKWNEWVKYSRSQHTTDLQAGYICNGRYRIYPTERHNKRTNRWRSNLRGSPRSNHALHCLCVCLSVNLYLLRIRWERSMRVVGGRTAKWWQ